MIEGELPRRKIGVPVSLSDGTVKNIELKKVPKTKVPSILIKKNFWKDKPLGRTLTGRNKTGKLLIGIVAIFTGLQLENVTTNISIGTTEMEILNALFTGFEFTEWATIIAFSLMLSIITWAVTTGYLTKKLAEELKKVISEFRNALDPDSEGGKTITDAERQSILNAFLEAIEQFVYDKFGWSFDINANGKKPVKE
jgi:hypothetical protein